MKLSRTVAPLGAALALALTPAAALAASPKVSVRIEGAKKTLLPATAVTPGTGSFTRGGATKGACSYSSAQGALDKATRGRWSGSWSKSLDEYFVTSILGEKASGTKSYWDIFVNRTAATAGACDIKLRRGQQIVFAVVPATGTADLLAITGAPSHATASHAFTVKVVYYDAKGRAHALKDAKVSGSGASSATTNASGEATITPTKAGKLRLTATHPTSGKGAKAVDYVRAETGLITVAGNYGGY